jgi:hypothetical protein
MFNSFEATDKLKKIKVHRQTHTAKSIPHSGIMRNHEADG